MGEEKVILNKTVFDTAKDGGRHNGLFRRNKEARRSEIRFQCAREKASSRAVGRDQWFVDRISCEASAAFR